MNSTVITRAELHELLWSEPIKKIAARFGVRPIEIVNAADQAAIPRPPGGHWVQLAFGKASERIPLQPPSAGRPETVTIVFIPKPNRTRAIKQTTKISTLPEAPQVADVSQPPVRHKLVRQTEKALRGQKPDYTYGWIYPGGDTPYFNVRICKDSIDRTLEILDTLVKGAEKRGIEITENKLERSVRFAFKASEELVQFSIVEKVERRGVEPVDGKVRYWKEYTYHPTGRLEFQFEHVYGITARWKWADGSTQRLEDLISSILDSVPHIGSEKHRVNLEWEAKQRRRKEEERIREEKERQIAFEEKRREHLFQQLKSWDSGRELRAFAKAARSAEVPPGETSDYEAWLLWIDGIAYELDPFTDEKAPWVRWADHVRKSNDPLKRPRYWSGDDEDE